ncbi:hypothetical protein E4H12_01960 [Candidatus Thorarchaeota archaeon]|nr:MAG: hypothetical protein E4H12_01960 [Candidatus Thorarchaeota archaeon]
MSKESFSQSMDKIMSGGIFSQALEKAKGAELTGNAPAAVFRLEVEGTERTWMHYGGRDSEFMRNGRVLLGIFSTLNLAYEAAKADFANCGVDDELKIDLTMSGKHFAMFIPVPPEGEEAIDAVYFVDMYVVDEVVSEGVQ